MADPTNDPHEGRASLIVAGGATISALAALGVWVYVFHDQTYVYARNGQDASFEIIKRGVILAGFVGLLVALILTRVLSGRDNAYTFKR
jgi:hypothetical protein